MKLKRLLSLLVLLAVVVTGAWAQEQSGEAQTSEQQQTGGETQPVSPDQPDEPVQTEVEVTVAIVDELLDDYYKTGTDASNTSLDNIAYIVYQNIPEDDDAFNLARTTQQNVSLAGGKLKELKNGLEANNTAVSSANTITGNLNTVNELVEVNPSEAATSDPIFFEFTDADDNKTTVKCINAFGDAVATFDAQMKLAEEMFQNAQSATSDTEKVNYAIDAKNYLYNANSALTSASSLITSAETVISTARTDLTDANSALSHSAGNDLIVMQTSLSAAKDRALDAKTSAATLKTNSTNNTNIDANIKTYIDIIASKTEALYNEITPLKVSSAPGATALEAVGPKITGLNENVSWARQCLAIMQGRYNTLNTALTASELLPVEPDPEWGGDLADLNDGDNVTAKNSMTLTGSLRDGVKAKISIAADATVTLDEVTIIGENDMECEWAGLTCLGDATIILKDGKDNSVRGFFDQYPGIFIPSGYTLTIKGGTEGTGTLTASNNGWAAGIGGGYQLNCGSIEIQGGIITAAGSDYAAGIGSGCDGGCGNITISGGTVTATGGECGAGIGSGGDGGCGDITIENTVTQVTAIGSEYGAGIGAGSDGGCGTITIGEGLIDCTAGTKRVIANGITDDVLNALKGQTVSISYSRTYTAAVSGSGKASTLCLPFDLVAKADDGIYATFSEVTETAGVYEVKMTEVAAGTTLTAGTPYMFLPNASGKLTQGNTAYTVPVEGLAGASSATNSGWQFKGTFEKITWPTGQKNLYGFAGKEYYLSNGSQIDADDIGSFRRFDYGTCAAFRCYLLAPESSGARGVSKAASLPETLKVRLVKADGTTTAIGTLDTRTGEIEFGDDWYDLNGRRLDTQPTKKGLYINNGKKVAIK
jgi:hypothetical protein